ncbi:MAG: hypothetical protein IKM71_01900 [Bacteroidaceae bacterium]|nr:hypothetical protein [Bacteroidaceae bacterium]
MKNILRWLILLPATELIVLISFLFLRMLSADSFETGGIYHTLTMMFIYGWLGALSAFAPYKIAPSHKAAASIICSTIMFIEIAYCLLRMSEIPYITHDYWTIISFVAAGATYAASIILSVRYIFAQERPSYKDKNTVVSTTNAPTPSHTPNNEGQAILCKDVPDGRISFRSIDSQKRIPNIEDLLNRHARSLTGDHMKKLAQAASSAPKEHLPAYYSAAAYYYFYIEHNPYSAYLCCVSTLSLLSCMSKYDLFMPEYQWIAREPELSSMLFDGDLGINQHYREFFSLDMISGRETGPLGAPILPSNHKYPH